ncbi:FUSC family protein [Halopseudomonas xiamenensis]|uniref:FUSC family protein n=1 Tax=Halopseudomonas xiamenensis TaxID=157792 RepID=UPI001628CD57|nr:FUSC family protein [Halopseudomonas xiamenensis]
MSKPSALAGRLTQLGFDVPRLGFAGRTALASCLALAWLIGLEHPQWSAMTVWAVSQPVRGMLVEKSLFRALGTLVGTLFGVLLVLFTGDNLALMVIGLSLWIGLCVGVGNLLSGLVAYGTLLSGYSATMVALLNTQQPAGQIFLLGTDRLLTVLTGILVGLLVGLLFTPRSAEDTLSGRVRRSTAQVLQAMAARFAGTDSTPRAQLSQRLLQDIAMTEQLFDTHAAGSLRSHRHVRALRALVQAQVGCVYWIRSSRNLPPHQAMTAALERAAQALLVNAPAQEVLPALETALVLSADDQVTADTLRQLLDSQREYFSVEGSDPGPAQVRNRVVLHRDWIGARHAALRATGLLLLIGAAWVVTGWSAGAYVMLGVSVMITLFSTFETPSHIMGHIFIWQLLGAVAALACHWLVWPLVAAEWQLLATLMPFVLLVVPVVAHQRTTLGSMDYVMVLLLLSHPVYPLSPSFSQSLNLALAVVAGPLLAYITFKTVWPADARRRRLHLTDMMLGELTAMAERAPPRQRQAVWRTRLYHRLLKLMQSVSRSGESLQPAASGSLAVLAVGNAIVQLHGITEDQRQPESVRRRARLCLQRLQRVRRQPQAAARSLRQLASQLSRRDHPAAWNMENAARSLDANAAFFSNGMSVS